jgi:hypothetical protein
MTDTPVGGEQQDKELYNQRYNQLHNQYNPLYNQQCSTQPTATTNCNNQLYKQYNPNSITWT